MASCPECAGSAMSIKFNKLPIYHLRNPSTARFAFSFLLLPFSKDNHFYRVLSSPSTLPQRCGYARYFLFLFFLRRSLLLISNRGTVISEISSAGCVLLARGEKGGGLCVQTLNDVSVNYAVVVVAAGISYLIFALLPLLLRIFILYICVYTAKWFTTCACAGGN